jgi:hypothetical protein
MRIAPLILVACVSAEPHVPDDTQSQPDCPHDPIETWPDLPCPFAGEWLLAGATCSGEQLQVEATVTVSGDLQMCEMQIATELEGCPVVERVEMYRAPMSLWEGYTNSTVGSAECYVPSSGPRRLGFIEVFEASDGSVSLLLDGGADAYLEVFRCRRSQILTLAPAPVD